MKFLRESQSGVTFANMINKVKIMSGEIGGPLQQSRKGVSMIVPPPPLEIVPFVFQSVKVAV